MNNITTCGVIMANTSKNIRIESKKINSQYMPYFFSAIKQNNQHLSKKSKNSIKIK